MRTASKILGIMGGIFAILFSVLFLLCSLFLAQVIDMALGGIIIDVDDPSVTWQGYDIAYDGHTVIVDSDTFLLHVKNMENLVGTATNAMQGTLNIALLIIATMSFVGGALGIIGGISVRRKNVSAGILMVCAGFLSLFTAIGIFASALLIIGGFLALVPLRKKNVLKNSPPQAA